MEDVFWESPYSSTLQDEYFLIKQNTSSLDFFKKQETLFNNNLRVVKDGKLKSGLLSKSFITDTNINSRNSYPLPIFSEEAIQDPKLTSLKDFNSFSNEMLIYNFDEVYESSKYINYLYYLNYKNLINNFGNKIHPLSYVSVFDS
jgi:hypothetical protein